MANKIEPSQACFGYYGSDFIEGVMAFKESKANTKNPKYSFKYENIFKTGKLLSEEKIDGNLICFNTSDCYYICFNPKMISGPIHFGMIETKPSCGKEIEVFGLSEKTSYASNYLFIKTIVPKSVDTQFENYGLYILKTESETYLCVGGAI